MSISLSLAASSLPTLFSKGQAVVYDVNTAGDTLTAFVDSGPAGLDSGDRVVFTLTVNGAGSWSFDLDDQLDHVDDGTDTENTALRTAADGSTSVASIDFSSVIVATDADGDSVTVLDAGDFAITVVDDIPIAGTATTMIIANSLLNASNTADLDRKSTRLNSSH